MSAPYPEDFDIARYVIAKRSDYDSWGQRMAVALLACEARLAALEAVAEAARQVPIRGDTIRLHEALVALVPPGRTRGEKR